MPDERSQFMNELFRSRSTPSFGRDATSADVNRAIRELAGYPTPEPAPSQPTGRSPSSTTSDPRSAARRLLADAAEELRESEPVAGIATSKQHDEWLYSRRVLRLLDQAGRLPGETGYDPSTASAIVGETWDGDAAMNARRARWQALARHLHQ